MRHEKKRGSLLRVKPEAPLSIHTVIYHQKRFLPKSSGWKADGLPHWVARAMLGCLDAANHTHGWGSGNLGTEEFNFIISSAFDSIAPRKRGFTAIRPHFFKCVNQKMSYGRDKTKVLWDDNQFYTPSKTKSSHLISTRGWRINKFTLLPSRHPSLSCRWFIAMKTRPLFFLKVMTASESWDAVCWLSQTERRG